MLRCLELSYHTTKYIYVCPVMVFISLLLSQREIENPLLLFHLLVDAISVAVFINLLSDEWDMYSLMFHENLPKLNLGHFWPGSLSAPGYQGIYSFSIEVRPSHYISCSCRDEAFCTLPNPTFGECVQFPPVSSVTVPGWGLPWLLLGSSWLYQPLTHLSPTLTFVDEFHPCFERSVSHFSQGLIIINTCLTGRYTRSHVRKKPILSSHPRDPV